MQFVDQVVEGSRRSLASHAVAVAFLVAEHPYASYHKTLGQCMGMSTLSETSFYSTIKMIYPVVKEVLDEQCSKVKEEMKEKPEEEVGSWRRAITSGDGVWLTRGFFSQNFTFTVWNYLTGGILYYMHLCMRGTDNVVEEPLYPGTAKSAESYAAQKVFERAKAEGMNIEVNWQDSDSSSGKSFLESYPDRSQSRLMLCGGHVNRAHAKQLKETSSMKSFSAGFISKHKKAFPEVSSVQCACANSKHSATCGCFTKSFLRQARINFFCALLEAGNSPEKFSRIMLQLGSYHGRDIHQWPEGQCEFHEKILCSCGQCEDSVCCEGNHTRPSLF